jgi:uncharacterized protein (UPF0262 family)
MKLKSNHKRIKILFICNMEIIIVGSGWFGLHTYIFLKENIKNLKITILEKDTKIFNKSSNYNQNRLHLGYHYPRSFKTRELCLYGYDKFINRYREVIDFIDNNYYLISNKSFIDYKSYLAIFNNLNYKHDIIPNNYFNNIDGHIINTKEKIINSTKARQYFKKNIDMSDIKLDYAVKEILQNNNKVIINSELSCDLLIDCTYNRLNLSKKEYIYELTISLLYNRIKFDNDFEAITVMDGPFFSLFPRDITKKKYTLTHVSYTPLIRSNNLDDINKYEITEEIVQDIKDKMETEVFKIYPEFKIHFNYYSYFLSYKCKLKSQNDNRECIIEENNNIINVNCGKIVGIFEFESYLKKKFNL